MTDEEGRMFSNRLREAHAEIGRLRAEAADQDRRRLFTLRELGLEEIERLRAENAELRAMRRALEPKP